MRIAQLIDSLEIGGAERMAVSYANALVKHQGFGALITTRKEGALKNAVDASVDYTFLDKKKTVDFAALFRLKSFCKSHRIEWLQAHSSSYFTAVLLKFIYPSIKIVWHDHNGLSENIRSEKGMKLKVLQFASYFFTGIIAVNSKLLDWASDVLHCDKAIFLQNFISDEKPILETQLLGSKGKRILCLANLRPQKDHYNLIRVAKILKESHPDWTFHLVGKDFEDQYSREIHQLVTDNQLENQVYIYGSKSDSSGIIAACDICILTSMSEGLPVSVLEYGNAQKPVVVTAVGQLPQVITNEKSGIIVPVGDSEAFSSALKSLIENDSFRNELALELKKNIDATYSEKVVISKYLNWLESLS